MREQEKITIKQTKAFQCLYDYFNENLFDNKLSPVMLRISRELSGSWAFYKPIAWQDLALENIFAEINLSPSLLSKPARQLCSSLVHEMCHHYQALYGKQPPRNGYHNHEFALIMSRVGLACSSTGQPGGSNTGQQMSHYIVEYGKFAGAFQSMPTEFILPFQENNFLSTEKVKKFKKKKCKTKYICSNCATKVWGKPDLDYLICGKCSLKFIVDNDTNF